MDRVRLQPYATSGASPRIITRMMTTVPKTFRDDPGSWLRRKMDMGISVTRIARRSLVSRQTIWRWVQGHSEPRTVSAIKVLEAVRYLEEERKLGIHHD